MKSDKGSAWQRAGRAIVSIVLLAMLETWSGTVWAGINGWTSRGPDGGIILALAVDPQNPSTVYAGTAGGGVFKSTNGGASWSAANSGLINVYAVAVDPLRVEIGGVFSNAISFAVSNCWSASVRRSQAK